MKPVFSISKIVHF